MTTAEEGAKTPLSTSQFYMWRMLLAIAWVDGNCGDEETAYFAKLFDNLDRYFVLTSEQRAVLAAGLEAGEDPWPLFSHINDPEPRRLLVLYAEALVMLDGVLDPKEEEILKRLRVTDPPGYDTEQLRGEVRKIIADDRAQREKEKEELRGEIYKRSPHVAVLDRLLRRAGIDILFG
jgi:hypothetical protein